MFALAGTAKRLLLAIPEPSIPHALFDLGPDWPQSWASSTPAYFWVTGPLGNYARARSNHVQRSQPGAWGKQYRASPANLGDEAGTGSHGRVASA